MSIKGFSVGGVVQRYDYTALDNLPQGQGVSDDLKAALLQLAQKVAYIDAKGQTYYDDLYDALYPEKTLLSITANFQQGQAVIYNTDSLDTLKQYLTVTAVYDDGSTATVASSVYTLSGTLTTGTSVITVTYEGKTDAFNVTVTAAPMSFPVTNNLTGCTTSNSATNVAEGSTYNAVITASSDYTLVGATVSITMGGQDITTSAYSGGVITISNVNGALVISVTAVERVLVSISAVYTQRGTVYTTDSLDSLKDDLVVTANYSDGSTQTIPSADYTLSGTLTAGTSTITVSYGGKTTTFSVTVAAAPLVPAEYQQVEYAERPSSATQTNFIRTEIIPTGTGTLEFDVEFMAISGTAVKYPVAITVPTDNSVGFGVGMAADNKSYYSFSGGETASITSDSSLLNQKITAHATVDSSGWAISDGTTTATAAGTPRNYKSRICLFGVGKYNIAQALYLLVGRIYYFKVTENNVVLGEFIPCKRTSDDAVGFYDRINETFVSSSVLVAGPVVGGE